MINGAHVVIYSGDSAADRVFFRDVLQFPCVDAGHGWLIFAMPPLEAAFHDSEKHDSEKHDSEKHDSAKPDSEKKDSERNDSHKNARHELFLMCDDLAATLTDLKSKHVTVSDVSEQRWGSLATLTLPSGGKIGLYQPRHPSPLKR